MRSTPFNFRLPNALLDAFNHARQDGAFRDYPSDGAVATGFFRYGLAFLKEHRLTPEIARMPVSDQDEIDDFIYRTVVNKTDIRPLLPKPATGLDLLKLAREKKKS